MKNILIVIGLLFYQVLLAQIVNIPDLNFKNALLNHNPAIDLNGDNEIQVTEAESLTGLLNLYSKNISELTGIEAFTNIIQLDCSSNNLTSLSLRFNIALINLDCEWNSISYLDISHNIMLETLNSSHNQLTELNVSNNIELTEIKSRNNLLSNEWFGNCPMLSYLDISFNQIYDIELSYNPLLSELYCFSNQLTNIDTSNNTTLAIFDCTENSLTGLDVSNNTQLTKLYFSENSLTNIDVSNNESLIQLSCAQNLLTSLDLSNNPNLIALWCHFNQLVELDLSSNPSFTYLWCNNNENLNYMNLKNGNNTNFDTSSHLHTLPNLETVCVDDINYDILTDFILDEVNHNVTFIENCELHINEFQLNDLVKIYPNPARNILYFSFNKIELLNVGIFNSLGQLIISKSINSYNSSIDISAFPTGVYLIKLTDGFERMKIVKILKI